MGSHILALDVGTSAVHCLLADPFGTPMAADSTPIEYIVPDSGPALAREFDPEVLLNTCGILVGKIMRQAEARPRNVAAVSITSQRQGVVFLDSHGREVYCGPNIDLRAIFEGAAMDKEYGEEIYATTGHFPSMLLAPARLRWFQKSNPAVYEKTSTILSIAGWLAFRASGVPMAEASLEGEAGLLDITRKERCPVLMERLRVPDSLLPPLSEAGTPVATLTHQMAERWGLRAGIPVIIAGPDTQCGLLGMGLRKEGQAGAVIGWSGALQMLVSRPYHDEEMRTWAGCHPVEGLWVAECNLGDAGNAYSWLHGILLGDKVPFDEGERLARKASAAPEGVSALLGPGPVSPLKAGLKMGGIFFPTPLSFHCPSRGQLLRAALDNIAYSVKANLDTLHEVTGLGISVLHMGGGMSRSRTLATTLANVLGTALRRTTWPQVSARGAAVVAAMYLDPSFSLEQAGVVAERDHEQLEPDSEAAVAEYQECYRQWLRFYERLDWD